MKRTNMELYWIEYDPGYCRTDDIAVLDSTMPLKPQVIERQRALFGEEPDFGEKDIMDVFPVTDPTDATGNAYAIALVEHSQPRY